MVEELSGQHAEQDESFQNAAECGGNLKLNLEILHAHFQSGKKEGEKGDGRDTQPGEPCHHDGSVAVSRTQIRLKPVECG